VPAQASTDFLIQHPRLFPRGALLLFRGLSDGCLRPDHIKKLSTLSSLDIDRVLAIR